MVHCGVLVHSDQLYLSQLKVRDPELHESKHKRHFHSKHKKLPLLLTWSEIQKGEKLLAGKLIPELVILHH
jgi:hypothetical protein